MVPLMLYAACGLLQRLHKTRSASWGLCGPSCQPSVLTGKLRRPDAVARAVPVHPCHLQLAAEVTTSHA
jgi:hypothetical protein